MVINACHQFYVFTAVTLDYGIIQNQNIYPFRTGEPVKSGGYFYRKEHQKTSPVIGYFIQEPEQVFTLKNQ